MNNDAYLESYGKTQDRIDELLAKQEKHKVLFNLAKKYYDLAHDINNLVEIEEIIKSEGTIAIAVQVLLSSYSLLENEALMNLVGVKKKDEKE